MHNRISLKAVQAFEAAARFESFALAADDLFVTPSAISHQVKLLEELVGVRLFHRVHRAVVLTDAGRKYAEEISAAFARIDAATRNVVGAEKSDVLAIHCTPSFATQWLMPRLARYSALQPDVDVRLNASVSPVDLMQEEFDVDIRYGMRQLQPAGTLVLPLPRETIVPLCAPGLITAERPLDAMEDLSHHMLIHSVRCLVTWRDWMRQHRKVKLDISRGLRFDRSFMSISAAVDGLGVCLDSLLLVERELESGRLIAPFGRVGLQVQAYTFNVLKSKIDLPKIRSFQHWLFSELAEDGANVGPQN
ncbi:transcriptional regulator GcvA [Denitromonas ohlonensis]|uniref:Transcriptional regulator GcvA n=2 Tax=Denitromonas TaxID=139331 RepID=A0A557S9U4_9RHOO|nr:transcriptional regulator GcvA [Denitromonas ohlonensis]TVO63623.1 transcriptional regulator GcvA [Denitromonas ohlonensis]TVO74157.1 transcriptional regulator GcvA [Denitromonas ohlonensis]